MLNLKHSALLAALLAVCSSFAFADVFQGKVVAVSDGDTITVLDANNTQQRVRLAGIDAPESHQPFGSVAKALLSELVFGKEVIIQFEKRDRYGRIVGKVLIDGRDISLEMVKAGLAWHYKEYEKEQSADDRRLYAQAEIEARKAVRGLWADQSPTPPWDFRRESKAEAEEVLVQPPAPTGGIRASEPIGNVTIGEGVIVGHKQTGIYYGPDCLDPDLIPSQYRIIFSSTDEAEKANYKLISACPKKSAKNTTESGNSEAKTTNSSTGSTPSTGGTVYVRGYYRKDGTYVQPHTRRAPSRRP